MYFNLILFTSEADTELKIYVIRFSFSPFFLLVQYFAFFSSLLKLGDLSFAWFTFFDSSLQFDGAGNNSNKRIKGVH